jgi:transcription antitermination factor NusG
MPGSVKSCQVCPPFVVCFNRLFEPTIKAFSDDDSVEIIDGPFKGLKAVFKAYSGEERAILLLDFMAKHIHAKFDLRQFKKVA